MVELAVIMSVYQNDKLEYLEKAIQSILNQTYSKFDFFICFDGKVQSEIEDYISSIKDKRIKLFRKEKNSGLAIALNLLLSILMKNHNYKLIARMDADDISLPNRFEKQIDFLITNPGISIVGCWYEEIDEKEKHLSFRRLPTDPEDLRKRYFTRAPFAHPSVIYRRELIEKVGFYPTDTLLMEDNVLWGRALKHGLKFSNIPEYLLKFRIDNNFFERRSGLKYGWNFINKRIEICKSLNSPLFFYLVAILIGIFKMSPSFTLKYIYVVASKISFVSISL